MYGVTIGDKHSYKDFGLILSSQAIAPPEPRIKLVDVPMRDGSVDLTEAVSDTVRYQDRKITLTFSVIDARNTWVDKISKIQNYLHGQRMKIVFDEDTSFYYIGRVQVNTWTSSDNIGKLVLNCTVEPYKYDLYSTSEEWIWDTFDFEYGVANDAIDITVSGTTTTTIIGRPKGTAPIFTANAEMTVTVDGVTYDIHNGTTRLYDLILKDGENVFTFSGNGTVTIDYRGGSL